MFAIIALIAFVIGLVIHLVVGRPGLVLTFELLGFIAICLHFMGLWAVTFPWVRRIPPQ